MIDFYIHVGAFSHQVMGGPTLLEARFVDLG